MNNASTFTAAFVDDHVNIIEYVTQHIRNHYPHIQVLFVADGFVDMQERIVTEGAPDLLVLDVQLQGESGYVVASWMQRHYPDTRIIVYSALDTERLAQEFAGYGIRGIIGKGESSTDLVAVMQAVVDKGYYFNAHLTERMVRKARKMPASGNLENIPPRRMEVLLACQEGLSHKEIAHRLNIALPTVNNHFERLFAQFGVSDKSSLIARAYEMGILSPTKPPPEHPKPGPG